MNEQIKDDEIEIDLLEVFQVLKRQLAVIIACLVVGVLIAGLGTKLFVTPLYSSSSTIYVLTKTTSVTSLADIQMGSALTADFQQVASSRTVVEKVIKNMNLDTTYEDFLNTLTVENPTDTHFLKMTIENPDPKLAMEIANEMSSVTATEIANIMTTDKPTTVEKAITPKNPSSPNTRKNAAIGGLLCMLLCIAVILVKYFLDDTLKNEEDVEKYLGINTLAAIPIERGREKEMKDVRKDNKKYATSKGRRRA